MKSFRSYLGDSVYVELDTARRVILTTNNGNPDDPRNIIFMEPDVISAFNLWLEKTKTELERVQ